MSFANYEKQYPTWPYSYLHSPSIFAQMSAPWKRFAVVTERQAQDLISALKKTPFQIAAGADDVYAFVFPEDRTFTMYLCDAFWDAPNTICKDSKPGTLIHEASHFLDTDGIDCTDQRVNV
jgi:hypothetical protein